MKRALLILAVVLALATVIVWTSKGANPGWTKNKVQVKTVDPVTEIEQIEWQDKFVPGVDVLGVGFLSAGVLAGISLFLSRKTKTKN